MATKEDDKKGEKEGEATPAPRRSLSAFFWVFLFVAGLCAGGFYYWHSKARVRTDDAYVHATIYPISPRVPGTVLEVLVEDNQVVEADQVLARLDQEDPSLKVRMAEAALASAQTGHQEAKIGLAAAEAEDRLTEAKLAQAKLDLERAEVLWKKRSISQEQLDRTVTENRVLAAQRLVAQARIAAARAQIASSEANLENTKAQLDQAELMFRYTEIRSPQRGHVSQKAVEEGQVVQPGTPLMAVVDLEDLWIEANFKENQLERIRPGQQVEVRVDVYPGHVFHGLVHSIHAGTGAAFSLFPPENATGNWVKIVQRIPVKIVLDGHAPSTKTPVLRVGMSSEVTVYPAGKPDLPWPLSRLAHL